MQIVLHILTEPGDTLAEDVIARQKADPENQIDVVDLTQTEPDYKKLLEKIFAADSVQVW